MMARGKKASGPPSFSGEERLAVIHGEESFLVLEYQAQLRRALEEKTGGEVQVTRFEGRSAALADVLDELRSFSLMQQHKLVVLDDTASAPGQPAGPFVSRHREALERYAADPAEISTLLLRPATWNGNWKLSKAIAKQGVVVKCEHLDVTEAERWAVKRAKAHHRATLTARAATLLVEHLGADLSRLDSELGKLAVAAGEDGRIEADHVEALVGRASDEIAWEIQEAMLSGDAAVALAKVHELVDLAGQPEILVSYFAADLVRKLYPAAIMVGEGASPFEIGRELKIWGGRQRPFAAAARKLGTYRTARLLQRVVDLDRRSKTGFGRSRANLERFCVEFADELA